jgi:hypothetical protein
MLLYYQKGGKHIEQAEKEKQQTDRQPHKQNQSDCRNSKPRNGNSNSDRKTARVTAGGESPLLFKE